jgi:hypothetical protein
MATRGTSGSFIAAVLGGPEIYRYRNVAAAHAGWVSPARTSTGRSSTSSPCGPVSESMRT